VYVCHIVSKASCFVTFQTLKWPFLYHFVNNRRIRPPQLKLPIRFVITAFNRNDGEKVMAISKLSQIVLVAAFVLSGCTDTAPVADDAQTDLVMPFSGNEQPVTDTSIVAFNDVTDTATLRHYHIGPHKVECQGSYLTQCMLSKQYEQASVKYFYDLIEGFDYQWGYEYELLVSVTTDTSLMSDTAQQRYELIEIIAQSEYQHQQSFEYVARYANESIVKVSSGEYRLAGNQSMVCEPASCASIDSALEQGQSVLLDIQYAEQPGDSLQLAAVLCMETRSAFNSACMGENQ